MAMSLCRIAEEVGQECHLTVQSGLQTETVTLSVLNVENVKLNKNCILQNVLSVSILFQ
jgi:hypothetical protein